MKLTVPYLSLCEAFMRFAIVQADERIAQGLPDDFLMRQFPRLSRTIWRDLFPLRWLWKILFAKLGADGVLKVLIRFCRGHYDLSAGLAVHHLMVLKAQCDFDYFRAWVNETALDEIADGLVRLEDRYRVAFQEGCLGRLAVGLGVDFKKTQEELRALLEEEAKHIVLPVEGGLMLRLEHFKPFRDANAEESSSNPRKSDEQGGVHA